MTKTLEGQVAVITGGARGQGRSHALFLAREGADVVLIDSPGVIETVPYPLGTEDDLARTKAEVEALGRRCLTIVADVRDGQAITSAVDRVVEEFGRVDIMIANAGIATWGELETMTDETWAQMIDVNLTGVFHCFRAVAPHMKRQQYGRVVATASTAGQAGYGWIGHYVASKWGVIGLTKSFAHEMATHGVTVNAVCPTTVNSDMIQNESCWEFVSPPGSAATKETASVEMVKKQPQGVPWIEVEDVSHAVLYLVSPQARFVTGETMTVSAGRNV